MSECKVTVRFGPSNSLTRMVPYGTPLSSVINDPSVKAVLGYGSNVQAMVDRRHVSGEYRVGTDMFVEIETIANSKASEIEITISFGPSNSLQKSVPAGSTVGAILADPNIRGVLGFGENVRVLIDRVAQPNDAPLSDGDSLEVETVANSKAA